jgi:hypothetical protein
MKKKQYGPICRCHNGCDAPVCPPSLVICKACLDKITDTLDAMIKRAEKLGL